MNENQRPRQLMTFKAYQSQAEIIKTKIDSTDQSATPTPHCWPRDRSVRLIR